MLSDLALGSSTMKNEHWVLLSCLILSLALGCSNQSPVVELPAEQSQPPASSVAKQSVDRQSSSKTPNKLQQPLFYDDVVCLGVGVSSYDSGDIHDLPNAEQDATRVTNLFAEQYGFRPRLLLGKRATKSGIIAELDSIVAGSASSSAVVVYFAIHGYVTSGIERTDTGSFVKRKGYLLPYGTGLNPESSEVSTDAKLWDELAIDMGWLVERINQLKTRHVVLIVDTCSSGYMTKRGGAELLPLQKLLADASRSVIAATTQNEKAIDGRLASELENLMREAASRREVLSITDLFQRLRPKVISASQGTMTPQMAHVGMGDGEFIFFPLGVSPDAISRLKAAVARIEQEPAEPDFNSKEFDAVRDVITRRLARGGKQVTLNDVQSILHSSGHWFGEAADSEIERWKLFRQQMQENAAWGDGLAMAALHFCYSMGVGERRPEPNNDEAAKWALAAKATSRHPGLHEFLMGRCYRYGIGVPKNEQTALGLYERSAELGFSLGKLGLATLLNSKAGSTGGLTTELKRKVFELLTLCTDDGITESWLTLADKYANGDTPSGVKDFSKAIEAYQKAFDLGNMRAAAPLFEAYCEISSPKEFGHAEECLRRGAKSGDSASQYLLANELGNLQYSTVRLQLAPDRDQAIRLLESAASQNHPLALVVLARAYSGTGTASESLELPINLEKCVELIDRGVATGNPRAMYQKAYWLASDSGVYARNPEEAFQLAQRSAQMGDHLGCFLLANYYETGTGVELDSIYKQPSRFSPMSYRVYHWYMRAIMLGEKDGSESDRKLKQLQGNINVQKAGIPWDKVGFPWPLDVLQSWKERYPETCREFERRYPTRELSK